MYIVVIPTTVHNTRECILVDGGMFCEHNNFDADGFAWVLTITLVLALWFILWGYIAGRHFLLAILLGFVAPMALISIILFLI